MIKNRKSGIRQLLSTMLKIGTIGFGGGTALIPVIEEEVVENNGLTDEEEFNKDVIIANITPGALPVEIAAGVGRKMHTYHTSHISYKPIQRIYSFANTVCICRSHGIYYFYAA